MSRPKGSKNKPKSFQPPTKAKRKQSIDDVLNEFQNEMKNGGATKTENTTPHQTSTKTLSINRTTIQDTPPIQEPQESPETSTPLYDNRVIAEDDENELVSANDLVPPISISSPSSTKKLKQIKPVDLCKRCGDILNESPYRIDTTILTGLPDYHREHPRFVKLCRKCCIELSEQVDNWLGSYPKKFTTFGVKEEDEM